MAYDTECGAGSSENGTLQPCPKGSLQKDTCPSLNNSDDDNHHIVYSTTRGEYISFDEPELRTFPP
jgi:hypothetical protein